MKLAIWLGDRSCLQRAKSDLQIRELCFFPPQAICRIPHILHRMKFKTTYYEIYKTGGGCTHSENYNHTVLML